VTAAPAPWDRPVTVVIPAHDEAGSVGGVVQLARRQPGVTSVLVVDDGSTDRTAEVARRAGAEVVRHAGCLGNGAALKTGLAAVGSGVVVVLDADGQHDPSHIPELLARLDDGADLAVAARRDFRPSGACRDLGNRVLARWVSLRSGHAVPDLTSGFRAFRRELVEPWLPRLPDGFGSPAVMVLAALAEGRRLAFVSVPSLRRARGASHTRLLRDGARMLATCFAAGRDG
jgi:glycosyltransferase involved in cell wall biosynthesis